MKWQSEHQLSMPLTQGRIRRVIRFGDTTVGEAMIPIAEVTAINQTKSSRRAVAMVRNRGYNRLPVYTTETSVTSLV